MEHIPHNLRMKMMVDAIVGQKAQKGWKDIHYNIRKSSLYLKKTFNLFIPPDIMYENILRANTTVYFKNGKIFTWLKKMNNMYYYQPAYMRNIGEPTYHNIDSYGYFLDDDT